MENQLNLYIDFETRSALDIGDVGVDKYVNHSSTEAICFAWAIGDAEVQLWKRGEELPEEIGNHLASGGNFVAHNAGFDALIFNKTFWPHNQVQPEKMVCTQAMCRAANLPASLGKAAEFLALPFQKMTEGKLLVKRLSRPKSIEPLTWDENPAALERMYEYCKMDVKTLAALYSAVPCLSDEERAVWIEDHKINRRGIRLDRPLVENGQKLVSTFKNELDARIPVLTGGAVRSCTEVKKITEWAQGRGAKLEAIGKKDIVEALEGDLPEDVRQVLLLRKAFAKTSASKLGTMTACMADDGRVRDQFVYHGAGTGRWSGRLAQIQNLPRIPEKFPMAAVLDAIRAGDASAFGLLGYTPSEAVSAALRAFIIPEDGKVLFGADFSAIEARVLAWLSGQNDIVARFAAGEDIYCYTASKIFGRPITEEDDKERLIGKVAVLALGYQGGVGAFDNMAKNYGLAVDHKLRRVIIDGFRSANEKIVSYWRKLEEAASNAVEFPNASHPVGVLGRHVTFRMRGDTLTIQLPSGRVLSYPKASKQIVAKFNMVRNQVVYKGGLAGRVGMFDVSLYGGLLAENVTQAVSRDCMVEAMKKVTGAGYLPIATIHDEILSEGEPQRPSERYAELMTMPIEWAPGLPLAVKHWKGPRYVK